MHVSIFKNHKQNFKNNKQARLINPTKILKNILQRIVTKILNSSKYILWKSSLDTIEWFKNIKHKNKTTFIQFDIIDFYPSITKEFLLLSINLARNYIDITQEEYDIILTCRKSVLVYNTTTWEKKTTDNFDVTMGSFDSIQVADFKRPWQILKFE